MCFLLNFCQRSLLINFMGIERYLRSNNCLYSIFLTMKTILCNNGSIRSYVIKQLVPWGFGLELIHSSPWLVEQGDEIDAVFLLRLQN